MNYKRYFKNRENRLRMLQMLSFVPSDLYLKLMYQIQTGHKLNLNNPKGFNEKLNWLKIHQIRPEYARLVDKIEVRNDIDFKLGPGYMFPILGIWDHFDDIDFDSLPDSFVLKCNHDSGSVKLIRDKATMDKAELKRFFEGRLRLNTFYFGREYPYKSVKPRIFAEELMCSPNGGVINDYKFFCFHGEPKIMFIATDREKDCRFDFYDMDFNHLDIVNIHPQADEDKVIERPVCFDEMKKISEILSAGFPFVRIDLFEVNGKVYFGEYTFFHGSGFYLFKPDHWEQELGEWLEQ